MLITPDNEAAQNLQFIKTHNDVKQTEEVCLYLIPKPHKLSLLLTFNRYLEQMM